MQARYRERLWPSPGVWVGGALLALSAGLVVVILVPPWVALLVVVVALGLVVVGLVRTAVVVEVADGSLRAGRASIELAELGRTAVVDPERMRRLRGPDADPRAYLCQRGWLARGVVVEVADPRDPAPYWLVSSRTPERLAAALGAAPREPSGRAGGAV